MKIYMASSWKNIDMVRSIAQFFRDNGHEVDDFTDSSRGRYVFFFRDLPGYENLNAVTLFDHDQAVKAFIEDRKYIDWSEVVFLLLPSGKSAHLEAGYAAGSGKKLIIFQESYPTGEFDVMYGFADLLTSDMNEVLKTLAIWDKSKMKFYEFNDFEYSALIAAKTIEEAIDCYKEQVADIDEKDGTPDEITREEAEAKYSGCSEDSRSLDKLISDGMPTVILMDSDLC